MDKKFILNAIGFGKSKSINDAVSDGFLYGILKSVSIIPNGEAFEQAINEIIPKCEGLGVGINLNITDGKSICADLSELSDGNMRFNNSYLKLLIKAYNPKNKEFLQQTEREFRRQIEKVLSKTKIVHIDSNAYIHSVPPIFDLVCRLAKEYKINYVCTHFEPIYFVPDPYRHCNKKYLINACKKVLLNLFSVINENTLYKYGLKTNDFYIGTSYESAMDAISISYALNRIHHDKTVVMVSIHPCRYEDGIIDNHFDEYMITKNSKLKNKIEKLGYEITNYVEKSD
ncbi:MAG: ChbG/HpnK family deacetylase [bacterium]|nr:ChbG/HpnK family deacetylase [bacterium]